jgi:hypothetical protein
MIDIKQDASDSSTSPVNAVRVAIWRLFEDGYMDEDMATAGLLAVDLGARRARRGVGNVAPTADTSGAHCRNAASRRLPRRA